MKKNPKKFKKHRKRFKVTNEKALKFFIKMKKNRYYDFEKWLIKGF
jgi:hypothetical protein